MLICHFSIHKTFSCQEDNNQLKVKRKGEKFLVQSFAGNLGYKKGEKKLFLKGGVFSLALDVKSMFCRLQSAEVVQLKITQLSITLTK